MDRINGKNRGMISSCVKIFFFQIKFLHSGGNGIWAVKMKSHNWSHWSIFNGIFFLYWCISEGGETTRLSGFLWISCGFTFRFDKSIFTWTNWKTWLIYGTKLYDKRSNKTTCGARRRRDRRAECLLDGEGLLLLLSTGGMRVGDGQWSCIHDASDARGESW